MRKLLFYSHEENKMLRDISPQMAGLVSNWCNTLLYGITLVTYIICVYVLVKRRRDRNYTATWILIGTSTVQFILSTIYVALGLRLLIEGFIHTENVTNGPFLYWINPATKSQIITKAVYITNSVVGDSILIWRVYMVWGKNIYVCLLPIVLTCCTAATGYVAVNNLAAISGNLQPNSIFKILHWILSTWCLSIATQVISTGLIAGRIWWHARLNPVAKSGYVSLIAIIVESGAIYTVSTAFLLAFADLKTQAGAILGDMTTQLATIVPTLIIIRVELSRSRGTTVAGTSASAGKKPTFEAHPMVYMSGRQQEESSVQVTVSTLLASDTLHDAKPYGL